MLLVIAAIIIEEFANVRRSRTAAPSILDDAMELLSWTLSTAMSPSTTVRWLTTVDGVAAPRSYGPMGENVDVTLPTYSTLILAFDQGGPLHSCDPVTPELLAAGLGIATLPVARLIAEILHATPLQTNSGWVPTLPHSVITSLSALSTPSLLRAQKSAIFSDVAANTQIDFLAEEESSLTRGEAQLSAQVADLAELVAAMREEMREMRRSASANATVKRSSGGSGGSGGDGGGGGGGGGNLPGTVN